MIKLNVFGYDYVSTYILNLTPLELRQKMASAKRNGSNTVVFIDYATGEVVELKLDTVAQMTIKEVSSKEVKDYSLTTKLSQKDHETALIALARMVSSGDIPVEVYNKYLADTKVGLLPYQDLVMFLLGDNITEEDK